VEVRQLEHFVAVAEERHFGRAARRCHIGQSGLSVSIQALETDVGVPLFVRTSRTVRLSNAGLALLPHAHRILNAVQDARASVTRTPASTAGRFVVGIAPMHPAIELPGVLARMARDYPTLDIAVRTAPEPDLVEQVSRAEIDGALLHLPEQLPANVEATVLAEDYLSVICSAEHPVAQLRSVELVTLTGQLFVEGRPDTEIRTYADQAFQAAGIHATRIIEVDDASTLLAFVADGHAIAVLPRLDATSFADDRPGTTETAQPAIRVVNLEPIWSLGQFGLITRPVDQLSQPARAFAAMFADLARRQVTCG
jgi:DNA-binding transcriptional LysR family regulator